MSRNPKALLVIDMQQGLFHASPAPSGAAELSTRINRLIQKAHDAGAPVFFARFTGPAGSPYAEDSPLTQLIPELTADAENDVIFTKHYPDCFRDTGLQQMLTGRGISELVIAGMQTEYCVDTTCRTAPTAGFTVTLVSDGHTTIPTEHLSAEQIIAHHNATLSGPFVTLCPADAVTFGGE